MYAYDGQFMEMGAATIALILAAFLFFSGWNAGSKSTCKSIQTEAVKAGAARWVPNDDGSTRFEWTTNKEQNQ